VLDYYPANQNVCALDSISKLAGVRRDPARAGYSPRSCAPSSVSYCGSMKAFERLPWIIGALIGTILVTVLLLTFGM